MKKRLLILVVLTALLMIGCSKGDKKNGAEVTPSEEPTSGVIETTPTAAPTKAEESHEGQVKSLLTGQWVKEEVGMKRPFAIMLNNIEYASPQSGTTEASILYEALAEGGITRLMGIFEELNDKRIGSTRSARHYFVSVADEYNAIFVHYGQTTYATKKIKELGIDTLSGLSSIGETVFYRDNSIKAPHNAFTSKEGIEKGMKIKGYETDYSKDYEGHFKFYDEDTTPDSNDAVSKLSLSFSSISNPYFTYDESTKTYLRYQFGKSHIDKNTGKQLAYKNIIIQLVKEWNKDNHGYQTMDIENAEGKGYYITDGKRIKITWKKNENTKKMRYYDSTGEELTINPGKTYIALFPENREEHIQIN
ncbi:DUF3048 domain-containing protein [Anaerocolumna xylanovorans]|nr:DUF3048 domain-containing protein [Anaerocolumna xylanovorans]